MDLIADLLADLLDFFAPAPAPAPPRSRWENLLDMGAADPSRRVPDLTGAPRHVG